MSMTEELKLRSKKGRLETQSEFRFPSLPSRFGFVTTVAPDSESEPIHPKVQGSNQFPSPIRISSHSTSITPGLR